MTPSTQKCLRHVGLVEVWQAPVDFDKARNHLCTIIEQRMGQYLLNAEGVCGDSISFEHGGSAAKIGILHSRIAKPHVDDDFPEWSALWVLQASGQVMGIADHRPSNPPMAGRRPLKSPMFAVVPLRVGQLVVFNLHRTHWMDRARDRSLMVAASFDFQTRPSRSDVEKRIRAVLRGRSASHT
jgi:hypothetical protein